MVDDIQVVYTNKIEDCSFTGFYFVQHMTEIGFWKTVASLKYMSTAKAVAEQLLKNGFISKEIKIVILEN